MTSYSKDRDRLTSKPSKGGSEYEYTGPEVWRALVLHPDLRGEPSSRAAESSLEEAVGLAQAIELDVVWQEAVRLNRPKAATLFGGGVVERMAGVIKAEDIGVAVVDSDLSPVQQQFSVPLGVMIVLAGRIVRGNIGIVQPHLTASRPGIGVTKVDLPGSDGLNLSPGQDDTSLVTLQYLIVEKRSTIGGYRAIIPFSGFLLCPFFIGWSCRYG